MTLKTARDKRAERTKTRTCLSNWDRVSTFMPPPSERKFSACSAVRLLGIDAGRNSSLWRSPRGMEEQPVYLAWRIAVAKNCFLLELANTIRGVETVMNHWNNVKTPIFLMECSKIQYLFGPTGFNQQLIALPRVCSGPLVQSLDATTLMCSNCRQHL